MANTTKHHDFAAEIEAVLRERGHTIPQGGLFGWVVAGWTEEEIAEDNAEDAADLWIESLREANA